MSDLATLVRDQENDYDAVNRAVDAALARVSALDQNLRPDVLQERGAAIRREAADRLADLRAGIAKRAEVAAALARKYTPAGERRAARFAKDDAVNAAVTNATYARLARTPTSELLEHLGDAVEANNLAAAEAARLELIGRPDFSTVREEFHATLRVRRAIGAAA